MFYRNDYEHYPYLGGYRRFTLSHAAEDREIKKKQDVEKAKKASMKGVSSYGPQRGPKRA